MMVEQQMQAARFGAMHSCLQAVLVLLMPFGGAGMSAAINIGGKQSRHGSRRHADEIPWVRGPQPFNGRGIACRVIESVGTSWTLIRSATGKDGDPVGCQAQRYIERCHGRWSSPQMSSAAAHGPDARPCASRQSVCRMVSIAAPL